MPCEDVKDDPVSDLDEEDPFSDLDEFDPFSDYYDSEVDIKNVQRNVCKTKAINGKRSEPCIFPFVAGEKTYSSCSKGKNGKYLCATKVDSNGTLKEYGECEQSSCCMTKPTPKLESKQCIFPFTAGEKTYSSCSIGKNGKYLCATKVDSNGTLKEYGECEDICPRQ